MIGIILGLGICGLNVYAGLARTTNYKHCTNCVTKGISSLRSNLREYQVLMVSMGSTLMLIIMTLFCKWNPLGILIALAGFFVPIYFKKKQAEDRDYIKNQRRFTKGGLRVAGKSTGAVAAAVTTAVTGGAGAPVALAAGNAIGKGFDSAADNMSDVDMDYKAPDVDSIASTVINPAGAAATSIGGMFSGTSSQKIASDAVSVDVVSSESSQVIDGDATIVDVTPSTGVPSAQEVLEAKANAQANMLALEDLSQPKDMGHNPNDIPQSQEERDKCLRDYIKTIGFKEEDTNNAPYEKCINLILNSGAAGSKHPMVRVLNAEGFSDEDAVLYIASHGGTI